MLMHVTTLVTASRLITRGASESEWNLEMITESYLPVPTWLTRYSVFSSRIPSLLRYIYSEIYLAKGFASSITIGARVVNRATRGETLWGTLEKILNNRGEEASSRHSRIYPE